MGSVALYRPGQWLDVLPTLRREQHNIHFAGEHLGEWQGYMEGAVQSGMDAAEQIAGQA
jgi:monoamine oxidase